MTKYEVRLNNIANALRDKMAKNETFVVKETGDKLGMYYSESENGYMVYYYGNVKDNSKDCDLLGVWETVESFAKNLI